MEQAGWHSLAAMMSSLMAQDWMFGSVSLVRAEKLRRRKEALWCMTSYLILMQSVVL